MSSCRATNAKAHIVRRVPVHPALAAVLRWWRDVGHELVTGAPPTHDSPLAPRATGERHTRSTGYKTFRRACRASGVRMRSVHSTRHTLVTLLRRHGAPKDVVAMITHGSPRDVVDGYTHWEWAPLCEAMALLPLVTIVDAGVDAAGETSVLQGFLVEAPGIEPGAEAAEGDNRAQSAAAADDTGHAKAARKLAAGAERAARQQPANDATAAWAAGLSLGLWLGRAA